MPAYYFVNQGSTFEIMRDQGYMFTLEHERAAPGEKPDPSPNFPILSDMRPADVCIINRNGLVGLATVKEQGAMKPMAADFAEAVNLADARKGKAHAYWKAGMLGMCVPVSFQPFDSPIDYTQHQAALVAAQNEGILSAQDIRRSVLASNGYAKQTTFFRLSRPMAEALMEICGQPLAWAPSRIPSVSAPPQPQVYVAKFEQRETRPEQAAFRELLMKKWGNACPVTGTAFPSLLEAAHFADWRYSNGRDDGMLLDVRLHRAVDAELVTITLDVASQTWSVRVEPSAMADAWLSDLDERNFPNPQL